MPSDDKSKQTRASLWNSLLDAEMNVYYWRRKTDQITLQDRIIRFVLAVTSSGAAVSAWGIWLQYPSVWKVISGITSVLALYHTFFYSSERLKKSATLLGAWKESAIRFDLLWTEDKNLSQPKAKRDFEKLKERQAGFDESLFATDVKLVLEAQRAVRRARGITNQKL